MTSNFLESDEQHGRHPDVEALLRRLPATEAERLREVWELAGAKEPGYSPTSEEVAQALTHIEVRLQAADSHASNGSARLRAARREHHSDRRHSRQPAPPRVLKRFGWATAAIVLLIGGLGLFWLSRPVTQAAPPGERVVLTLPDGSSVELNSGSRLRYPRQFGSVRRVHLLGEAFFDVAEAGRPLVVETFDAQVRVLSTRFSVRAWPGELEGGTMVALEEGRVTLAPAANPGRAVEMAPGETRRVVGGADLRRLPGVSVDDATAWRRGDLVFKDEKVGVILQDVERRYEVDILVRPVHIQHKRLNLALRRPASAEAVIRDVALALGLSYRETSTGYELFQDTGAPLNP